MALPIILSAAGFLPAYVMTVAACAVGVCAASLSIVRVYSYLKGPAKESEYAKNALSDPIFSGVIVPVVEEVIFRAGIQAYLTEAFKGYISASSVTVLGIALPGSTAAIAVASVIFGAAHAFNPHEGAGFQAVLATVIGGYFGVVYHQLGLGASCLAHIFHNTMLLIYTEACRSYDEWKNPPQAIRV